MKFSMTAQEKGDLLIQVTAGTGLTGYVYSDMQAKSTVNQLLFACYKPSRLSR